MDEAKSEMRISFNPRPREGATKQHGWNRGTSNRIDFAQRSSMSPIPGVPFSDFLEMFKISLEEMLPEIRSGRLVITIQTDTGGEGNKFITPAQFHAWVNNPQTPANLRKRAMARVKTKMN
jgi:hypothetical protein